MKTSISIRSMTMYSWRDNIFKDICWNWVLTYGILVVIVSFWTKRVILYSRPPSNRLTKYVPVVIVHLNSILTFCIIYSRSRYTVIASPSPASHYHATTPYVNEHRIAINHRIQLNQHKLQLQWILLLALYIIYVFTRRIVSALWVLLNKNTSILTNKGWVELPNHISFTK